MSRFFDVQTTPCIAVKKPLQLVVLLDDLVRHPLPASGEIVLGRGTDCGIQVDDPSVSRRHAVLALGPDGITLRDLESSNGTRLRGSAIGIEPVPVAIDDMIELGSIGMVIRRVAAPHLVSERVRAPVRSEAASERTTNAREAPPAANPMERVRALLDRIAAGTISVLILGETGVGKEVLAEAVHHRSPRASKPFLRLNCAALTETLLESELFGHERGAFTGADRTKEGLLETANGGTVFLDEIGELPLATQVKLLRVLEQREVQRVGGLAPRPIDVRFVAATHRDLQAEIAKGRFRQDLYFRLNGITLKIPPLRDRLSELDALTKLFLERAAASLGVPQPALDPDAWALLRGHVWPGNIRELRNVVERAVLLAAGGPITTDHVVIEDHGPRSSAPERQDPATSAGSLSELRRQTAAAERERIMTALARSAGNQKAAAELLGISRRSLSNKLDQYAIARPRKGAGRAA